MQALAAVPLHSPARSKHLRLPGGAAGAPRFLLSQPATATVTASNNYLPSGSNAAAASAWACWWGLPAAGVKRARAFAALHWTNPKAVKGLTVNLSQKNVRVRSQPRGWAPPPRTFRLYLTLLGTRAGDGSKCFWVFLGRRN